MIQKHPLLKSTAILTCAGMVSRIIGFFYRIFLSKTIGAEGIGIYLLLFPVQTLLFSLTSSGIQTAISRFVSARLASNDKKGARDILLCGMMLSVLFSGIASFFLYQNANFIAVSLLHEARCSSLLKILSFTLPFAGVHACIIGYYTGLKKAAVPAISQLVEQTARVASSFLFWQIMVEKGIQVTPVLAMYGMLTSEIIVVLYTGTRFLLHHPSSFEKACPFSAHSIREILTFSLPLSTNRVCLSLLQSAESICIPLRLQAFGLAKSAALSSYGTLTGMALPLVFFLRQSQTPSLLCCCRLSPNHRLEKTAKRSQDFLSAPSRAACCLASSVPFSFWSLEICAESCFLTATRPELTSRSSPGSVRSSILAQRLPVF